MDNMSSETQSVSLLGERIIFLWSEEEQEILYEI